MKEIRNLGDVSSLEGRTVEGYAIVFDSLSNDLGGFHEIISRSALDGIIENLMCFAYLITMKIRVY